MHLVEIFGILGFVFGSGAFLLKRRHQLLTVASFGSLMWSVHFYLLGAYTASFTNVAVAVRSLVASKIENPHAKHLLFGVAILVFSGITIYSWQGYISLLPFIAVVNSTFAYAYLNNIHMRWAVYLGSTLWIINSVYWGSWFNVGAEVVRLVLTTIGLIRVYRELKQSS